MADKAWKAFERRVARFFQALLGSEDEGVVRRQPGSGGWTLEQSHTKGDIIHPTLYIECKQRKKFAVVSLWDDTKEKAKAEGKTPVVCLSEKGRKGFWIMVHSDDLVKL